MSGTALRKFWRRARNAVVRGALRLRDRVRPSFPEPVLLELARLLPSGLRFSQSEADRQALALLLEHRFDLLGSGWVNVRHGMRCRGIDGMRAAMAPVLPYPSPSAIDARNRETSSRIAALLPSGYQSIDWHLDFRSGYRWPESTWYRDIRHGGAPGVDVKVPWELSRMQHLPDLAIAYSIGRDARLGEEFRAQILDWIAHNPPRFGVNWASTMDVGIRAVNWLVAFDLLRASGARFDAHFNGVFAAAVVAHGEHIVRNLEWAETRRANHYLGDIAGLAWIAAYLPSDRRSDAWLLFALQELAAESRFQFLPDGAHFEASTAYHGLCAAILAVCAALFAAVPRARWNRVLARGGLRVSHGPGLSAATRERVRASLAATGRPLPEEFYARLSSAARFARELIRHDGSLVAIGDDDSGRLLQLGGWIDAGNVAACRLRFANLAGFDELANDARHPLQAPAAHRQWLAWVDALVGDTPEDDALAANARVVAVALAGAPQPAAVPAVPVPPRRAIEVPAVEAVVREEAREFPGGNLLADARHASFPWFGVYVLRSARLHLVIRCGDALRDGAGAHAHDDQLAIDLTVDGRAVARDPGTYVYTADPATRARYRAPLAHCAPAALGPTKAASQGVFGPPAVAYGECRTFADGVFEGIAPVAGGAVIRRIEVTTNRIAIRDEYRLRSGFRAAGHSVFSAAWPVTFSPGYGVRLAGDPQ